MGLQIIGTSGIGYIADVNIDQQLQVNTPITITGLAVGRGPGFLALVSENDPGTITGERYLLPPETDDDYRLRVGVDSLKFFEPWAQSTINSGTWSLVSTTLLTTVTGGYCKLNSSGLTTANGVARIMTLRTFPSYSTYPIYVTFQLQVNASALGIPNTQWEAGLCLNGTTANTATPTDGIYLRMSSLSVLTLVSNFAGAETTSAPINYAGLAVNTNYEVLITVTPGSLELWINNVLYAEVATPTALPDFTQSLALPFNARIYNTATPPASATTLAIGAIEVSYGGMNNAASFPDRVAMSEQGGYQTQSGTIAPAQTAQWANNAAPATITLAFPGSNTAAAYTTFGGAFIVAAPAGSENDALLFGFQVPANAAGAMNRNLLIRGVRIRTVNIGAAVATTATVLQWGIAVGSSVVSLAATSDTTTTSSAVKSPRRKALGMQGFIVGAAIGTEAQLIDCYFGDSPLFAEPGSFVQIMMRIPVGTATASQLLRGIVDIDAQYE
jgi:hypothetical protein